MKLPGRGKSPAEYVRGGICTGGNAWMPPLYENSRPPDIYFRTVAASDDCLGICQEDYSRRGIICLLEQCAMRR